MRSLTKIETKRRSTRDKMTEDPGVAFASKVAIRSPTVLEVRVRCATCVPWHFVFPGVATKSGCTRRQCHGHAPVQLRAWSHGIANVTGANVGLCGALRAGATLLCKPAPGISCAPGHACVRRCARGECAITKQDSTRDDRGGCTVIASPCDGERAM